MNSTTLKRVAFSPLIFIMRYLTPDMKRMIFIASLFSLLKRINQADNQTLDKFNQLLKLSCRSEALLLPMYIHTVIWNTDSVECSEPEIMRAAPKWLLYGSIEQVVQDVHEVITSLPDFAVA